MGQEAHDLFDLKGATLDLCQQNTKSTIPFVLSSKGYGFVWNNPAIGRVEFGTSETRWVAEAARQIDYLVIVGDRKPLLSSHRICPGISGVGNRTLAVKTPIRNSGGTAFSSKGI